MASKITPADLAKELELLDFKKFTAERKLLLDKTDAEKILIQHELAVIDSQIETVSADLAELTHAIGDERNAKHWALDKDPIAKAINDNYFGYLIPENKVIYCKDFGASQRNASFQTVTATGKTLVRLFEQMCNMKLKGADEDKIITLMQSMNKSYLTQTSSFNKAKWNSRDTYNQSEIIMNFWLQPDMANRENYNKDFDILMHCVGGGKLENMNHLEQWIGYKYLNPDKVANTPNLDVGGQPGGNGKGRYAALTKTIFTPVCVIEGSAKEISAGFNANWANAVVIHYDEPEENELQNSKIKNATGGEEQRIEKKGVDAYMADRNHSFLFTSNNENGVVTLTGTRSGEDRRYSVISTNIVMVDYIMQSEGVNFEIAKERTNSIAMLVKDNAEVAKWLAHVLVKHDIGNMQALPPLHGIDYANRFEDQKDTASLAFDAIYPVFEATGFIAIDLLVGLVKVLTDNPNWKSKGVKDKFISYLKYRKVTPFVAERIRVNYMWNGKEEETNSSSRKQKNVICINDTVAHYNFDYKLVLSKRVVGLDEVTNMNCALHIN